MPMKRKRSTAQALLLVPLFALLLLVAAVLAALFLASLPALAAYGASIFTGLRWDPEHGAFGGLPALYGSAVVCSVALLLAVPLAIGNSVFLVEFLPPRLRAALAMLNDVMAAFPTILYGYWGLFVLGPLLRETLFRFLHQSFGFLAPFSSEPYGPSYLLASMVLSIMIIPFATSLIREVYLQIPRSIDEGIYALGLSRWDAVRIKLSYIRRALAAGFALAFGRAIGETVAVALTVGGSVSISPSLLSPGVTIPALIANQFGSAFGVLEQGALFSLALLLFAIGLAVTIGARLIARGTRV